MCTYNGEKYLEKQIDSIINQTYNNIELIIVDDCSSDTTVSIIKNYQKNYSFIKLFENELNLGFIKNFEKAISLCSGDYIALSDQDDVWKNNKLEVLFKGLNKNESFLVYSDADLVDHNLMTLSNTLIKKLNINPITNDNNLFFIYQSCVSGNTLMFRKELIKKFLPIPSDIIFHDLWIAFVAASIGPLSYVDECLVLYRQHDNNVSSFTREKLKIKKSYNEKINKKVISIEKLLIRIGIFNDYLEKNYPSNKNSIILKNLYNELLKYKKYYFNYKLFKLFNVNKKTLFPTKKRVSAFHLIKFSLGIKLYKIFPFI